MHHLSAQIKIGLSPTYFQSLTSKDLGKMECESDVKNEAEKRNGGE